VTNDEVLHRVKDRNILHTKNKGRLTELVTSCTGSAFSYMLLKKRQGEIKETDMYIPQKKVYMIQNTAKN
jgi:hypothetical protein